MLEFHNMYRSITASSFKNDKSYREVEPSSSLKPYIRCFWGSQQPFTKEKTDNMIPNLVIPDTCMDIIFDINYTKNKIDSSFVGINDTSIECCEKNDRNEVVSTFGIRFYAWTAILFTDEAMTGVKNHSYDIGCYFTSIKKVMEPLLFEVTTLNERIAVAEKILLHELNEKQGNPIVEDAVFQILKHKGTLDIMQLSKEIHVSSRQLERLCNYNIGISPKQLSSMIRYQYLWNEIVYNKNFNILDAVEKYRYVDQSHLLRDFKKYHCMNPYEAKAYTIKPCRIFTI